MIKQQANADGNDVIADKNLASKYRCSKIPKFSISRDQAALLGNEECSR